MEKETVVELKGVAKRFQGKQVLERVDLRLLRPTLLVITGPSGIGKTTALEILAGTLAQDSGIRTCTAERIGFAPQDNCLIPWQSAEENILFVLKEPEKEAKAKAAHLLDLLGLGGSAFKKPAELSGGMQRRLNIARSLAVGPDLLILDEPFAFQDSGHAAIIAETLLHAREHGAAVVVSVQEGEEALLPGADVIRFQSSPVVLT